MPDSSREIINLMTLYAAGAQLNTSRRMAATGAQTQTQIARHARWIHTSVLCRTDDHVCIIAALLNAVHVHNQDDALKIVYVGPIPDDRFGTINAWMERIFPNYAL